MSGAFDITAVRQDFPTLARTFWGKSLVYLDSAASALKPRAVIDAEARFYAHDYAPIHRAVYQLAERATAAYEGARARVQRFLGAEDPAEIVFVRGTTEAINLVARSFLRPRLQAGDEVLVTEMEHHSNLVPWQIVCNEVGARLAVVPVNERGELRLDELERRLGARTKLLAVAHVSNVLGTVNPVREVVARARARGVPVLIDGAQAAAHLPVNVQELGCDFYAFSGHKVYGPTGIGALYGRRAHLQAMPPYQGGGGMIFRVTFEATRTLDPPLRFEAGSPNAAGAVGLAAALDYLSLHPWEEIAAHEQDLLEYATAQLTTLSRLRLIGTSPDKASVLSFVIEGAHPHDLATVLDREGVAIRAGHHCAQPLMDRFGVPATARASFALYNRREDVDRLVAGLRRAQELFG